MRLILALLTTLYVLIWFSADALALNVPPEQLCERLEGISHFRKESYTYYISGGWIGSIPVLVPITEEEVVFDKCLSTNNELIDVSKTPEQKECEKHGVWVERPFFNGTDYSKCRDYTSWELQKTQQSKSFKELLGQHNL